MFMVIADISLPITLAASGSGGAIFMIPQSCPVPPLLGARQFEQFEMKQMAEIRTVQVYRGLGPQDVMAGTHAETCPGMRGYALMRRSE